VRDDVNEFSNASQRWIQKTLQPVLTQWWHVEASTAFLKSHRCIVFRATQIAIDIKDTKSCPDKTASSLQSLMKESVACSNLLFLAQLHTDFLTQRFKWPQEGCVETWLPFMANPRLMLSDAQTSFPARIRR
jgi:hypothetical protein